MTRRGGAREDRARHTASSVDFRSPIAWLDSPIPMNRPQLLAYVALPIVGVIGFALGRLGAPSAKPESAARAATASSTPVAKEVRLDESLESARTIREDAADEASAPRDRARMQSVERLRVASQGAVGISGILKVISITSQLSVEEIPAALALAKTAGREIREVMYIGAIGRWADLDPRAAVEGARALKEREGNEAVELAITEWAQRDAGAARAWLDALPKEEQPGAARGYLTGLAMSDP